MDSVREISTNKITFINGDSSDSKKRKREKNKNPRCKQRGIRERTGIIRNAAELRGIDPERIKILR